MRYLLLLVMLSTPALAQNSPCYWSGQLVKCLPTTGIYLDTQRSLRLGDATTNYVELKAGAAVTTYSLTWPLAQAGGSGYTLSNDGTGVLTWAPFGAGTVTSVSGTPPIQVATGTTTPVVSITQAGNAGNGYLSSTDWQTFNSKVGTATAINTTAPLAGGGDLSTSRTLSITQAGNAGNGYLSSTDWQTFNNKQTAISIGAIGAATTNGITLSAGTLALAQADGTHGGVLTTGSQSIAGQKTMNDNFTLGTNLIYTVTNDSTTTGSNQTLSHPTTYIRLTNASLTSIGALDTTGVGSGHTVVVVNATGGTVTIVNNYGSAPANSAILTGYGINMGIPNNGTVEFIYSSTAGVWYAHGLTLPTASSSVTGVLSSTDWSTFNNKQSTITTGNLTEATSSVLTITGGTGAVIGSGTSIQVIKSDTTHNGYLSSTDWTTFNNKVATTRSISTTAPLSGGGDLSADRTLTITQAGNAGNGYLSSTDWNTFNNKFPTAGVTDASSASAGNVGQVIAASGTSVTVHNTATNVVGSTAITAGDWDLYVNCSASGGATQYALVTLTTAGSTSETPATLTNGNAQSYMAVQGGGGNCALLGTVTSNGSVNYFVVSHSQTSDITLSCYLFARRRR